MELGATHSSVTDAHITLECSDEECCDDQPEGLQLDTGDCALDGAAWQPGIDVGDFISRRQGLVSGVAEKLIDPSM